MEREKLLQFVEGEGLHIIETTFSDDAIQAAFKDHLRIQSVLPIRHRVLGGLYQSINIKIGNFLEILLKKILDDDNDYTLVSSINTSLPVDDTIFQAKLKNNIPKRNIVGGGKSTLFIISNRNQTLIDKYISDCTKADAKKEDIPAKFQALLTTLVENIKEEKASPNTYDYAVFNNDVDLLFFKTKDNHYFYVELKKEDNHDSGKDNDMYKKVIKTFACLLYQEYSNDNENFVVADLTPILLFFGDIKKTSKILPKENVDSGETFFDKFFTIGFNDVCGTMCDVSNSAVINSYLQSRVEKILEYSNKNLLTLLDTVIAEDAMKSADIGSELIQIKLCDEIIQRLTKIEESKKLMQSDIKYLDKRLQGLEQYGVCSDTSAIKVRLEAIVGVLTPEAINDLTKIKEVLSQFSKKQTEQKDSKIEEFKGVYRKKYNREIIEKYL